MGMRRIAAGVLWGLLGLAARAGIDYVPARRAALDLVRAGSNTAALAAFTHLAAAARTEFQQADALEQAALCAHRLKDPEGALALAARIPLAAAAKKCRLQLLVDNNRAAEAAAEFRDEPIERWPDSLVGPGSLYRGRAHYTLRDGPAAEADLGRATAWLADALDLSHAWLVRGDTFRHLLKDNARALEAYARVLALTPMNWAGLTATLSAAAIHREQGRFAEAMRMLDGVDLTRLPRGTWRGAVLYARGETLAAQGNREEALARFREAAAVDELHPAQQASYEKKVEDLLAGP